MTVGPLDLGLAEQAAALRAGVVSADSLIEASLERRRTVDWQLNSVVATAPRLRAGEPDGPLHGAPILVKDSFALPWWAPRDATPSPTSLAHGESAVYRLLTRAGGFVFGVANMHQLAIGSLGTVSSYGPCRNPWDTARCPGGSSSGSAAAVAARIVAGSIGTDAAGSIRVPAAYCGVTGLKPTYGSVAAYGYTAARSTMGVIGPLARDSRDCRLLAEVLVQRSLPRSVRRLSEVRIGTPSGTFWENLDPGVEERCRDAVAVLARAGASVRPVRIDGTEHALIATVLTIGRDRMRRIDRAWLAAAGPQLDPLISAIVKSDFLEAPAAVTAATRLRTQLRHELARVFRDVDVVAWPTVPAPAPLIGDATVALPDGAVAADLANARQNGLANLTGIPAISIPCGTVQSLPVGLSLHAAWGGEALLLDVAEMFEQATSERFVDAAPRLSDRDTSGFRDPHPVAHQT